MQKYKDAVLHGSKCGKQLLPTNFCVEIEAFLGACEKEKNKAKKEGNLDEQEADPISFTLHKMICLWALETKNIFL